jgi:hypothetical protein
MSVHVAGGAVVRAVAGTGEWVVSAVEQSAGVARVERRPRLTELVVADAPRSPEEDAGFTAVACTPDGHALVITHEAPPALLVTASGCRTAPAEPGGRELLALGRDEALVLLSSTVLEARPALLGEAVRSPERLLGLEPAELLAALFSDVRHGAGAVLRRDRNSTDPEEPR